MSCRNTSKHNPPPQGAINSIKIREARIEEIPEIIALGNKVNEFQVGEEVTTFWPKHILENIIRSKTDFLIVAAHRNKIVGFVIANYNPTFGKAIIENIFVAPEYRGKGVSNGLRDYLLKKLKQVGCEYICTLVEINSKAAITSYKRYGFKEGITCVWLDYILSEKFRKK